VVVVGSSSSSSSSSIDSSIGSSGRSGMCLVRASITMLLRATTY